MYFNKDVRILFATRITRLFNYGFLSVAKYHFMLFPTNLYLQVKDHFCVVFAEI